MPAIAIGSRPTNKASGTVTDSANSETVRSRARTRVHMITIGNACSTSESAPTTTRVPTWWR